jgi:hypothetical protein
MAKTTLASYAGSASQIDSVRTRESKYHFAGAAGPLVLGEPLIKVCEIDAKEMERLFVEVVVATNALDQFQIRAQCAANGSFITLFSASGDFTGPIDPLLGTSGDLTVLGAGATGWFMLDVRSLYAVSIWAASGNVAGSTITIALGGN